MRTLKIENMYDYMVGAAIYSQGQPENFKKSEILIRKMEQKNIRPKMVDPSEVPSESYVYQIWQRSGGGYEYGKDELSKYLGEMTKRYNEKSFGAHYGRTIENVEREIEGNFSNSIFGFIPYCTSSSQGIVPMYCSAVYDKPLIDCDCAGTAMWPHLDEIAKIECDDLRVFCSPYDESILLKNINVSRQIFVREYIHRISGCWFLGIGDGLAKYKQYENCIVKGQMSKMMAAGYAIRKAREEGRNPITALISETNGIEVFKGKVEEFQLKRNLGLVEGMWVINGSGKFSGHQYKIWFSMENRISWLDGEPYISIPDINAVVDSNTCEGLSALEFDQKPVNDGMYNGMDVTVIGIEADKVWYELEGAIQEVNRKLSEYGMASEHRPMREII